MAPAASLIGPPELRLPRPIATSSTITPSGDLFMDAMVTNFNSTVLQHSQAVSARCLTENNSATYLSSGNPCLDFFFHVVPNTPADSLTARLKQAWDHDPLTTLKLICNLRGVRGTGKADKEGYYTAALWLHSLHPKTLACNVGPLAEAGYFKDLPEILFRLIEGSDVRQKRKNERKMRKINSARTRMQGGRGGLRAQGGRVKKSLMTKSARDARVLAAEKRAENDKKAASKTREEKKIAAAEKAMKHYSHDPDYRYLFDCISDFFAECLKSDMQKLNSGEGNKISLAAKWCPSLDSSFDRATLLCESIARKVFPVEAYPEYSTIEDAHYAYRVRDRLRKEVLVTLRKSLELPETYIGQNQWGAIPYNRVASVAMKFYKEKFLKHDKDRFEEYMEKVKEGKATIAAGALLPHEIIKSLEDGDGGEVAELQWKRMVDDVAKKGTLKNCIAVCDVSGSMSGVPMEVSVALGVLVSELSNDPWKGKVITFSEHPTLQIISGNGLREKTEFVRHMHWGMNTNFQKVFDLLLGVAVNSKLSPEQMIKRVFVFSDMEFDQANASGSWETDYEVIQRKFKEKGYGGAIPDIVFWNLRDSRATPVPGNQKGVALVSGYSKNLMTLFLDEGKAMDPETVMKAAITGPEYEKLVVID